MKPLFILLLPLHLFAQSPVIPAFHYIDSATTKQSIFVSRCAELLPGYHLVDSVAGHYVTFKLKNQEGDSVTIDIKTEERGNDDLRQYSNVITAYYITAQFSTMRSFYNNYFSKNLSVEEMSGHAFRGPVLYNDPIIWYRMEGRGYWKLSIYRNR